MKFRIRMLKLKLYKKSVKILFKIFGDIFVYERFEADLQTFWIGEFIISSFSKENTSSGITNKLWQCCSCQWKVVVFVFRDESSILFYHCIEIYCWDIRYLLLSWLIRHLHILQHLGTLLSDLVERMKETTGGVQWWHKDNHYLQWGMLCINGGGEGETPLDNMNRYPAFPIHVWSLLRTKKFGHGVKYFWTTFKRVR